MGQSENYSHLIIYGLIDFFFFIFKVFRFFLSLSLLFLIILFVRSGLKPRKDVYRITLLIIKLYRGYLLFSSEYQIYFIECVESIS